MKWETVKVEAIRSDARHSLVGGPFGSDLTTRDYVDEGVPVIRGVNLADDRQFNDDDFVFVSDEKADALAANNARAGDVVFTQRGTLGQVGLIPSECRFPRYLISQSQMKLTVDAAKANARFVFYYFRHPMTVQKIKNHAITSGVPHINLGILRDFDIPLPPLPTQDRIVEVLSAYDDLIENNRRRMALLEESARLLYQEWFVRLRFPGHEHVRIINGVAEGWRMASVGDFVERELVSIQTGPFGTQLKASDYTESGTPVINVRNIGYGDLRPDKLEFVPEAVVERLGVHILRPGDIVFGRKGAVDRHLLITSAQDGWMQGSDCIRLRALSNELSTFFLSFAFREESHREWMLTQCGNKATMASLNQEVIGRIPLIIPATSILHEFEAIASDGLQQIAILARQNSTLRKARDLLLPRLMSGELAV
jgi:type I restriction enzyme S subunit